MVVLDNRSVKDSIAHGLGRNKAAAFAAVPDVIKSGIEIDRQSNWKGRGYDSVAIAAPISINEEGYVAVVILTQSQNSNRFYLHEVALQKNLQDEGFKTGTKADLHQGDIVNVIRNFLNTSKVIDENGEPLLVAFFFALKKERRLAVAALASERTPLTSPPHKTSFAGPRFRSLRPLPPFPASR